MADYVVAGLKMAPRDATYTEQRDAILGAAAARGATTTTTIATITDASDNTRIAGAGS